MPTLFYVKIKTEKGKNKIFQINYSSKEYIW